MNEKYILGIVGIVCTTAVICSGVAMGHNGTLISSGLTAIGAIVGGIIGYSAAKKTSN